MTCATIQFKPNVVSDKDLNRIAWGAEISKYLCICICFIFSPLKLQIIHLKYWWGFRKEGLYELDWYILHWTQRIVGRRFEKTRVLFGLTNLYFPASLFFFLYPSCDNPSCAPVLIKTKVITALKIFGDNDYSYRLQIFLHCQNISFRFPTYDS